MKEWVAEVLRQAETHILPWMTDLERSYQRQNQRWVSGVRAHVTIEDELRHLKTERNWLYWVGFKKKYPRSSTAHSIHMQSVLKSHMQNRGRQLALQAIAIDEQRTYLVFDRYLTELIHDAAREFDELLEAYSESDHHESFLRQQLLRKYLEVWLLDAVSVLGRQIFMKLQVETSQWIAQINPESENQLRARECQVALLQIFGEL